MGRHIEMSFGHEIKCLLVLASNMRTVALEQRIQHTGTSVISPMYVLTHRMKLLHSVACQLGLWVSRKMFSPRKLCLFSLVQKKPRRIYEEVSSEQPNVSPILQKNERTTCYSSKEFLCTILGTMKCVRRCLRS